MSRLTILGSTFVFASIISGIALYKLEIRKTSINEEYEYIKKHRVFGSLTKYLSIISLISLALLILKIMSFFNKEFNQIHFVHFRLIPPNPYC